ncbi:MAG: hypothetical protein L6R41_006869, partial [Letrouitia leprolyta]
EEEEDEGGGGFLPDRSGEEALPTARRARVVGGRDDDDEEEEGGGGFLPDRDTQEITPTARRMGRRRILLDEESDGGDAYVPSDHEEHEQGHRRNHKISRKRRRASPEPDEDMEAGGFIPDNDQDQDYGGRFIATDEDIATATTHRAQEDEAGLIAAASTKDVFEERDAVPDEQQERTSRSVTSSSQIRQLPSSSAFVQNSAFEDRKKPQQEKLTPHSVTSTSESRQLPRSNAVANDCSVEDGKKQQRQKLTSHSITSSSEIESLPQPVAVAEGSSFDDGNNSKEELPVAEDNDESGIVDAGLLLQSDLTEAEQNEVTDAELLLQRSLTEAEIEEAAMLERLYDSQSHRGPVGAPPAERLPKQGVVDDGKGVGVDVDVGAPPSRRLPKHHEGGGDEEMGLIDMAHEVDSQGEVKKDGDENQEEVTAVSEKGSLLSEDPDDEDAEPDWLV